MKHPPVSYRPERAEQKPIVPFRRKTQHVKLNLIEPNSARKSVLILLQSSATASSKGAGKLLHSHPDSVPNMLTFALGRSGLQTTDCLWQSQLHSGNICLPSHGEGLCEMEPFHKDKA